MKKLILISLLAGSVILAGCMHTPYDNSNSTNTTWDNTTTGVMNTGDNMNNTSYHYGLNGTEPFRWADISWGNAAIFMPTDDGIMSETVSVAMVESGNMSIFTNINEWTSITLVADSACSDGMWPTVYSYTAVMIRSGTVYEGCANMK